LTAAIGLAFELNPLPFGFKKPICASLIGIDGEIIPSETNMRLFTENCKKQYENYVLFQAAERSYFLLLLRSLCWEDRTYFREYIRTAETIAGSDALHPLLAGYYDKGQQETYPPDYKQIARQVLEKATHLGEPGHALPIDIRHGLGHSVLTNSRSRANPSDPRGGCDFQPFMRVGSKYSSDDVFRVVASSDWVHFRFEANSYDGTISLNPPPVLDCWRY
jgi:hypothetical protein